MPATNARDLGAYETIVTGTGQELFGHAGDDVLVGGNGADVLTGGAGRDTFAFVLVGPYERGAMMRACRLLVMNRGQVA